MKKLRNNHFFIFLLLLITAVGAIPRAIEILSRNYLFLFDQGLFYLAVKSIVVDRHITLIGAEVGGIGGFFQGPGWYYLLTIPFMLFNADPYGGMILMFLLGVGSILLSMILFRKLLGAGAALLTGFFIALSPGIISQSRFIWPPFVIAPLTVIFLFFVFCAYSKKTYSVPLVFLTLGLMTHFEIATGGTLLLATLITFLIIRPPKIFDYKIILLSIFAFITTQATLILFDLRHNFIGLRGIMSFLTNGTGSHSVYSFKNHIDMYKDALLSVSYVWYVGLILLVLVCFSISKIFKNKNTPKHTKQFILFILIQACSLFLIILPLKSTLWSWWFLELPIYFCFLLGISFSYLLKTRRIKYVAACTLFVYFGIFLNQTYVWYKNDLPDYGGTAKIKGKLAAIDFIYKDAGTEKFGLLVFSPPVYTYPYEYLLWWYGKSKYGFMPPSEKRQTFYLLIEPDPAKPWSYKGWLTTVIKDGKVIKTVKLPSGFLIQKRTLE